MDGAGNHHYVVYRRTQGLSLTETAKVVEQRSPEVTPVQYATVLIAFEENTFSQSALATALKLASHRRCAVRVLITLEVPQHLDLDAPLPRAEAVAREIVEAARQWAGRGQHVYGTVAKVRPGEAGRRIVREARGVKADAIVMAMSARRPPGRLLGKTLEVVLSQRPCRVVIDSQVARPYEPGEHGDLPPLKDLVPHGGHNPSMHASGT